MKKEGKVSYTQKLRNLDILRGKQVWVKTSKGDVVFYSHLTDIYKNIIEGYFIESGENIGTVGSSGVPDRDYTNFHLHFSIMKNPYDIKKVGKYGYEDIMSWNWYLKGFSADEVIKGQENIFNKK
ncbi:MAG: M23 family metallopeptidase [Candidatus Gracilibacteria bacterium]|nr:M23 family metallopeptidase [Candidatus Gracilibacteria bacterium]